MKELCIEGLATHDDLESCVVVRENVGEALTEARAGRAIEPRNVEHRGADALRLGGRQHRRSRSRKWSSSPAGSENLCMRGISTRENREIPGSSVRLITGRTVQGRLTPHA
jgi:hypothetical protein